MAFSGTNFKHDMETRTEYRDRMKAEKANEQAQCYRGVDQRDLSICRVTDVYVTEGASDPHKRREHHHMLPRSRGGTDTMANVITISAFIHQLIHAGKLHLSGDANLKDQEGKFCGVKLERMMDGGWKTERML